jgi:hypothetical protein
MHNHRLIRRQVPDPSVRTPSKGTPPPDPMESRFRVPDPDWLSAEAIKAHYLLVGSEDMQKEASIQCQGMEQAWLRVKFSP